MSKIIESEQSLNNSLSNNKDVTQFLNILIPPDGNWPGAGDLQLIETILVDAEQDGEREIVLQLVTNNAPGFSNWTKEKQTEVMVELESRQKDAFSVVLRHVLNAYYTNERVLKVIEAETGYPARPPLAGGYVMEPFDESIVDKQRKKKPVWRPV